MCNNRKGDKVYRILELYSGIGGMRYAVEASGILHNIIGAVDVNTVVNDVYCHNFGPRNHMQRNIQSFTLEEIESFQADIVMMSPPCQPFTRVGLQLGSQDPRSESFLHILNIIRNLTKKPSYIFLENVVGFENSDASKVLIEVLNECGYCYKEFLLSPSQFGIPNSRMRYYIIAKLMPLQSASIPCEVLCHIPKNMSHVLSKYPCIKCEGNNDLDSDGASCIIGHFLENRPSSYFDIFKLSSKIIMKHAYVLDIAEYNNKTSCCFTKAYSRFLQGTGSVFHPSEGPEVSEVYSAASKIASIEQRVELLKTLDLRFFTPQEVANIMCFPETFNFPQHLTLKQKYQALGNSVNVYVVSCLFKLLLTENL